MLEVHYQERDEAVQETVVAGPYRGSQELEVLRNIVEKTHPSQMWAISHLLSRFRPREPLMPKRVIKVADFFCGPGGFSEGAKQACYSLGFRFQSRIACDFSKSALNIYSQNHGPVHRRVENLANFFEAIIYKNVHELEILDVDAMEFRSPLFYGEDIDLFLAGPPCEGNSRLNNHTRGDDTRNELYLYAVAIAIKLNVKAIAIENVTTVASSRQNVIERALKMLELHGYSHRENTSVLTASDFLVPQSRSRHFLMAVKGKQDLPPWNSDMIKMEQISSGQIFRAFESLGLCDPALDSPATLSEENTRRVRFLHDNDIYDLPNSERPSCHRDKKHNYNAVYGRMYPDLPASTLTTGFMSPGRGRYTHPFYPRSLTIREGALLQSFPISYRWKRPGKEFVKSEAITAIGDAVPPLLGKVVALNLLAHI